MQRVEAGSGDFAAVATAKVGIWRGPSICGYFFAGKRQLLLLGGREVFSEGESEVMHEAVREAWKHSKC